MHLEYLQKAISIADRHMDEGGGPFGALIVREGKIIAEAFNRVTLHNDPTAHAEIEAIRMACEKLHTFDLSGCTLYSSCEPCPMCLGAVYWSRITALYYASDRRDAGTAGFADDFIYEELDKAPGDRKLRMVRLEVPSSGELFRKWTKKTDKTKY